MDILGNVSELSAANIFIVRKQTLITPDKCTDLIEGINRKVVLDLAKEMNIPVVERAIDLTELYIADEVFACGTSSLIAPVIEIDARKIGKGIGPITLKLKEQYEKLFEDSKYLTFFSLL